MESQACSKHPEKKSTGAVNRTVRNFCLFADKMWGHLVCLVGLYFLYKFGCGEFNT